MHNQYYKVTYHGIYVFYIDKEDLRYIALHVTEALNDVHFNCYILYAPSLDCFLEKA